MTLINVIICVILWVSLQTNLQYPTYISYPYLEATMENLIPKNEA